jgi:hypothetical protein
VVQGDKLTIQLVENLQRSDLSPRDREAGIFQFTEAKNSIKEIASRLSKSETFVYRNLIAYRVRGILEEDARAAIKRIEGIIAVLDKEPSLGYKDENQRNDALAGLEAAKKRLADIYDLSTQSLNEIQGVKEEALIDISRRLIDEGGTVAAARRLMREYNGKAEPPLIPPKETEPMPAEESEMEATPAQDDIGPPTGNNAWIDDAGETTFAPGGAENPSWPRPQKPVSEKKIVESLSVRILGDPPPHKMVDLNSVQVIIKEYIDLIGNTEAGAIYQYKTDAAYEIWAHLLKEL